MTAAVQAGEDLYHLDEGALAGLDADLVVTQDLCAVCAVDVSVVDDALAHLGCTAEVLTIDPHTLDQVLDSVLVLGRATGREPAAEELVKRLRARAGLRGRQVRAARDPSAPRRRAGVDRPGLLPRPLGARDGGAWPAGSPCSAGRARSPSASPGRPSAPSAPDLVVCAPCGFELPASVALAEQLLATDALPPGIPVWAVDANASYARPGPRLVDGVEQLEQILTGRTTDPAAARRVR